jgi:hypothetical protein
MIKEVRDILEISKCFPLEKEIIDKGYSNDDINKSLANISYQIVANSDFHFWIAYKDLEIAGYMYFHVIKDKILIGRVWTVKWNLELVGKFKNKLMEFSKANKIKSWSTTVTKIKTIDMLTNFGFKPISITMGMEVI